MEALAGDLVGPYAEDEVLGLPPSRWYLTGFLVPRAAREVVEREVAEDDGELAAGNDESEEENPGAGAEPEPKQKNRLPASMGMSVLLPAGSTTDSVKATLRWADYVPEDREGGEGKRKQRVWKRCLLYTSDAADE